MIATDTPPHDRASVSARTIGAYASAVASGQPTPGGGSVVATVAALAAGLAEMVCNLTLARPVDPDTAAALTSARDEANQRRPQFLELATEDESAYGGYRDAAGLPRSSPAERTARESAIEEALRRSADVPLRIASGCVALLTALELVAARGSRHALADIRTSVFLADAALAGAGEMVRANTTLMKHRETAVEVDRQIDQLLAAGEAARTSAMRALDRANQ